MYAAVKCGICAGHGYWRVATYHDWLINPDALAPIHKEIEYCVKCRGTGKYWAKLDYEDAREILIHLCRVDIVYRQEPHQGRPIPAAIASVPSSVISCSPNFVLRRNCGTLPSAEVAIQQVPSPSAASLSPVPTSCVASNNCPPGEKSW